MSARVGVKLFVQEDLNPAVPARIGGSSQWIHINGAVAGGSAQARILISSISTAGPAAGRSDHSNQRWALYLSLVQTQVSKRFTSGLGLNAAYTWSKLLDNGSELFTYNNTSATSPVCRRHLAGSARERAVAVRSHAQAVVDLAV